MSQAGIAIAPLITMALMRLLLLLMILGEISVTAYGSTETDCLVSSRFLKTYNCARFNLSSYETDVLNSKVSEPVDITRVGDHFPALRPSQTTQGIYKFSRAMWKWTGDENRRSASTFVFEFPISSTEYHQIQVIMEPGYAQYIGFSDEEYAARLVKSLPFKTVKATRTIELTPIPREPTRGSENTYSSAKGMVDFSGTIFQYSVLPSGRDTTDLKNLMHEHGHSLAVYIFGSAFCPPFWQMVITSDSNRYVSTYARHSLAEDFAETLVEYFNSIAGTVDPSLRSNFDNRFRAFDIIYSERKGGLAQNGFFDVIAASTLLKVSNSFSTGKK